MHTRQTQSWNISGAFREKIARTSPSCMKQNKNRITFDIMLYCYQNTIDRGTPIKSRISVLERAEE